jgi:phosphatidylserine decarboxylase
MRRWPRTSTNGHFATLYLSPRDYHRIHMPCAGGCAHDPRAGRLFSVNPPRRAACRACSRATSGWSASSIRGGPFVLVLVGATIVGSMATVWHGVVNPPRPAGCANGDYDADQDLRYRAGRGDGPLPAGLHGGDAVPARDPFVSAKRWEIGSPDRCRQGGPAHLGSLLGREVARPVATSHKAHSVSVLSILFLLNKNSIKILSSCA